MKTSRSWVWPQIVISWIPVWALYAMLIATAHPEVPRSSAIVSALWAIGIAAILSVPVRVLTDRLQWVNQFNIRFALIHIAAGVLYAGSWVFLTFSVLVVHANTRMAFTYPPPSFFVLGIWLYVMVTGAAYAVQATGRAAKAEALAARSQLASLRAQLNPHFLFNALHTVVHLIPHEPARAAAAAEQLAGMLRTGIEEDRDLIPLSAEIAFVERYISLERIRFDERLRVTIALGDDLRSAMVPSFSLQSLVENAVRHGAAPREEQTSIDIGGTVDNGTMRISVRDTGGGATEERMMASTGTGIARLRDRLRVLYGEKASLTLATASPHFIATMSLPWQHADDVVS